jgi:YesN/AraC family two-component response regulator
VLVVEDEPLMRSFLRDALAARARVIEAEDGEQAIEILQGPARETLDLAVVDQVLPKLSGLEILEVTKRKWPWIPIVLLTGYGSEELAVKALRGGAIDYLRKPMELEELPKIVEALTARPHLPAGTVKALDDPDHVRAGHPNIHKGLTFMRQNFAEAITLSDVAREAGLSRFHFCRLFHHETRVPFHEYLHQLRITQAKALLADRYLRVSEIAYAVGFGDLSHFDRTFRRIVGYSPTQYRRIGKTMSS